MFSDQREENFSILEEAAALKIANVQNLVKEGNSEANQKAIFVNLLTDLQNEQDREMARLISNLTEMVGTRYPRW